MANVDAQVETLRQRLAPAVAALDLELYDVELTGAGKGRTLRVTVDRPGGVDLEAITAVTHAVSPLLDDAPAPAGPFLLEVSSPGVERALRRPEHYSSALGEEVSVKFHTGAGPQRVRGVLRRFDGVTCVVESADGVDEEIAISDVTQARTVFEWGPQPRQRSKDQGRARAKGKS